MNHFGVLNINKPPGVTSRDVVNLVQRLVRPLKCGHAGTLDPMATGVLLVCVGHATRLTDWLQNGTKIYRAQFQLGVRSDTDDSSGIITEATVPDPLPAASAITDHLNRMTGIVSQVPPAFSAVHVNGQRAYAMARRGEQVSLKARNVRIDRISLIKYEWPHLDVEVVCGSGTYIRSIARDLGEQLHCGGLMTGLERLAIGSFHVRGAVAPELLNQASIGEFLLPASRIVDHLPQYACNQTDRAALQCGKRLPIDPARLRSATVPVESGDSVSAGDTDAVSLLDEESGILLAIADMMPCRSLLQPRTVFCNSQS